MGKKYFDLYDKISAIIWISGQPARPPRAASAATLPLPFLPSPFSPSTACCPLST